MTNDSKEFLQKIQTVLKEHNASIAFSGNCLVWYVGQESFSESGVSSNSKSIQEMIENYE